MEDLLATLKKRFEDHPHRHPNLDWELVSGKLSQHPDKLRALAEMERTGGEPDVIGLDETTGQLLFVDCAPESPVGRRSLCFDDLALNARKENKPAGSAIAMANAMRVDILDEALTRHLQSLGEFDRKTSSWIATPPSIRKLGGALFMDRRYDHVFVFHNGADSYYASRGFRACLKV